MSSVHKRNAKPYPKPASGYVKVVKKETVIEKLVPSNDPYYLRAYCSEDSIGDLVLTVGCLKAIIKTEGRILGGHCFDDYNEINGLSEVRVGDLETKRKGLSIIEKHNTYLAKIGIDNSGEIPRVKREIQGLELLTSVLHHAGLGEVKNFEFNRELLELFNDTFYN